MNGKYIGKEHRERVYRERVTLSYWYTEQNSIVFNWFVHKLFAWIEYQTV